MKNLDFNTIKATNKNLLKNINTEKEKIPENNESIKEE